MRLRVKEAKEAKELEAEGGAAAAATLLRQWLMLHPAAADR